MKSFFYIFIVAVAITFAACSSTKSASGNTEKELSAFAKMMAGTYNSSAQAKRDTDYFNINLVMHPIWTERTDAKWMYVEQAMTSKLDKPYRVRVYQLEHTAAGVFTSKIYMIKEEKTFFGLHKDAAKEKALTFDKIEIKDGCTVTLNLKDGVYIGGTDADKCPSSLRGAKYATTKITMKKGELVSWDQGFDATNKQIWGATKGGYVFVKQ
jgi:uncharacterized protein with FMN-binding domain